MDALLAIVAYRCEVAGVPTESIDIQVRYFSSMLESEIEAFLQAEPVNSYSNDLGETVTWPLVRIMAIEPFESPTQNGKEVVGFIAGCTEFSKWANNAT